MMSGIHTAGKREVDDVTWFIARGADRSDGWRFKAALPPQNVDGRDQTYISTA